MIIYFESGMGDRKKRRKLVFELIKVEVKRSKGKDRKRKLVIGFFVDILWVKGSSDVVCFVVRELGWCEVCLCLLK